jgi:cytochrome c oxidase cbb3-type subunit 3
MADMPTDFWAGWIAALTIVSVLGLCWLVFSIYFSSNRQEQPDSPIWDESLSEGKNPAPMWWFWMTLIALVVTVIYLILYPGLGSFSGTLKWSQHGRLDHSFARYNEKFSPLRKNILKRSISELRSNDAIMQSAQRIFIQNCAACHGMDGKGQAFAFPNLQDDDWQWGSSEEAIIQSITHGRQAAMVGWLDIIGEEGVMQVKNYVKTLASKTNVGVNSEGKKIFQTNCSACHGLLGEGNQALGAPDLTDDIWLYGSSDTALQQTISAGRSGMMPAFSERLDEMQIRILTAWLMNSGDEDVSVSKVIKPKDKITKLAGIKSSGVELGKQVYEKYCIACHQASGKGLPGTFPSLVGNETVLKEDASQHIEVVLNGLKDKVIEGVTYAVPMPGFGGQLNDQEVAAVINHERSQWGNDSTRISSDAVAKFR